MKPKILEEKIVYKSSLSDVYVAKVRLPNNKIVEWDYFGNQDVVAILPMDQDRNVYFCKEWRPAWRKDLMQIPAGHCTYKTEKGRLKQAHNELKEEIGMDTKNLIKLAVYAPSARMNYKVYLYLAQGLFTAKKAPDEDEFIQVVKMPFSKAYQMFVKDWKLTTSSTIMALVMTKEVKLN